MMWLSQGGQDVRHAARMLRRTPVMTTAAILTLAVAVGLTAVIFSLVNAVLLRPLRAPDPDRLVWVATRDNHSPFPMAIVVGQDFAEVLLATCALLAGAALAASWIPARAAARIDPIDALRRE